MVASFLASKFANMSKYTTPALPFVPKFSSDTVPITEVGDYIYREVLDAATVGEWCSYDVTEITMPIEECALLRAPEECTPENFKRLVDEGKVDELKRLEEACYVRADYVNRLLECYVRLLDFLRQIEEAIGG